MDCENADPIYYKCVSVGIQRNTAFAAVVFLLLLAKPLFNKLSRMKEKYGMYNKKDNLN